MWFRYLRYINTLRKSCYMETMKPFLLMMLNLPCYPRKIMRMMLTPIVRRGWLLEEVLFWVKFSNKTCNYCKRLYYIIVDCYKLKNKLERGGKWNKKRTLKILSRLLSSRGDRWWCYLCLIHFGYDFWLKVKIARIDNQNHKIVILIFLEWIKQMIPTLFFGILIIY